MSRFQSFLSPHIESYITFRKAALRWNEITYESNLALFDKHCFTEHPKSGALTQEMVEQWCAQRATESNNSCRARIMAVLGFIDYMRVRGLTDVKPPDTPKREACTYIPHAFSKSELANFFSACDSLPETPPSITVLSRRLTVPVFFRLLYSSGIRTNEARMLSVEDVDLTHGVLNVLRSKGHTQHYIALHDTMLDLMKKYDADIRALYPERTYFFPSRNGRHHREKAWVQRNFRQIWSKCNIGRATAYDFRHNYAVENINKWVGEGLDFSKFVYLSKSMGHVKLESTKYYFHLVPAFADIMDELAGQSFDEIVPEVDYEES